MGRPRVGIRELRQNLSVYVRRVLAGELFEVTEHGRPVAILGPLPDAETTLGRLAREGRVILPSISLDDLGVPIGPLSKTASDALLADREDRL